MVMVVGGGGGKATWKDKEGMGEATMYILLNAIVFQAGYCSAMRRLCMNTGGDMIGITDSTVMLYTSFKMIFRARVSRGVRVPFN